MSLNCVSNQDMVTNPYFADEKVRNYLKEISKFKNLSIEEERELANKAKSGNEVAKQKLAEANLKLVVTIAKKAIHSSKLPMIDLIQEGNVGLMVAIDKFNPKFGYRFATYASWWIKQAMFKAISEQSNSVKIPVYIQETLSKYSKIKSEMERNGKTVKVEDVAKKMNIESFKINNYLNAYKKTLSLECDMEMKNGSEVQLADIIEDKKSSVQNKIEYDSFKNDIVNLIKNLKDREQKVILYRFGINECEKHTLEEIGKFYGVTKECIRQTEARALAKLKNIETSKKLLDCYLG